MKRLLLLASLSTWLVHGASAQSFCASDSQATPVALVERFISADCEACWSDPKTPAPAAQALTLDWIVPSEQGEAAPLSAAASRDARMRLESLGRADEIRIRLLPPEHPDLAAGVLMRLGALLDAGEIAKADALAQRSRDQLSAILRSESEAALQLEHTLSRIDALAGRPARALERLTAAIEVAQQRGKDSDMLARWCQQAGSLAGVVGDLDGATAWLDRAQRHFDAGKRPSDLGRGIDMLREVTTKALAARAADRSRGR